MALHLNPEAIAAIHAQLGVSGHFPQNQGKRPKWLFLAIWAHNAHLRTLTQSDPKDTFPPFEPVFAQDPKVAKTQRTQKHLSKVRSHHIHLFPSVFPSQDLWM
ncbi:hypothetical protein O181_080118 [Austropuccinia psidii MF-1]|uniref:Uncharacterized protein n=1 Tax=Austropuccinia psidii MF-1 TaxID=1389203 RepID=A0A9Q3FMA0_9BASI|nr:hypothetical protein [Austropuccinia psidii MF-1]